ncbi:HAD family hydrolase [Sphingomonas sp. PL-96]|uniref:HAD family hydrolase n=1 Tax=Sphingomonas sp. PL-96 TaxID=2887201 RepID=UPI001E51D647|nr:HAD-IA family hydrolase [Sphingomonas sp. PL-96]MCC2975453.1 HAD family hydrolase [Sphingomonas sp. PL-96]
MGIRAIFFDVDGTLVDSNDLHVLAWEHAFASIGARFDRATIHSQIGKGTDMLVPTLIPDADADAELMERLGEAHGALFKGELLQQVKPFPGAHDLLARVHAAGQTVVLASSASAAEVDHYLDMLDARELVDATTSSDDVEHTKPAPDVFRAALKKVAPLTPDEVLVVGDSPFDVEAAAACGIAAVALRSGKFPDAVLLDAGAVALYDDAAALLADYDRSPLGG